MKALVLTADSELKKPLTAWKDVPKPAPEWDEVLVRVVNCGVCGTDVHCTMTDSKGKVVYSGPVSPPVILGHEFSGEVAAVGDGVRHLKVGDLVTCESMIGCGVCRSCRNSHPNQCSELELLGLTRPGAFAEYVAIPERHCWSLNRLAEVLGSRKAACESGALVEPLACAYNGIFVTADHFRPGAHAVVYGAGPIGLGAVALMRLAGAATITVFEPVPERRALAEKMGANCVRDPGAVPKGTAAVVMEETRGHGADVQVECAGAIAEILPEAERCFAPGGALIYLGRTGEEARITCDLLVSGGNRIVGSRGHSGGDCFPRLISLLETGRLKIRGMITRKFPFEDTIDAIDSAAGLREGKVMTARG